MKKLLIMLITLSFSSCIFNKDTTSIQKPTQPITKVVKTQETAEIQEPAADNKYYGNLTPEPITENLFEHPFGCDKAGDPHKANGYYYNDPDWAESCVRDEYFWIPGLLTYESQFLRMPDLVIGKVYGYEANLMEHTGMFHEINLDNIEGIALPFCSEIGGYVWIKRPRNPNIAGTGVWEGAFRVVDCGGLLDLYNVVVHREEVAEIGFETAREWGMVTLLENTGEGTYNKAWDMRSWYTDILVSKIDPRYLSDDLEPVVLSDWFKERATFYETQEEFDNAYKPLSETIDGIVGWRLAPNSERIVFEQYPLKKPDDFQIEVDLSEQMLTAYINGVKTKEFIISSGAPDSPTPVGTYYTYSKYETFTMQGKTEPIPDVQWVTFFRGDYAIHGTYWHNDFGQPVSRGCINMRNEDAKWIYDRVDLFDTNVYIHK